MNENVYICTLLCPIIKSYTNLELLEPFRVVTYNKAVAIKPLWLVLEFIDPKCVLAWTVINWWPMGRPD